MTSLTKYEDRVHSAANYLGRRLDGNAPEIIVVGGSGLGYIADMVENPVRIPYDEIPGFPLSTAPGHDGILYAGKSRGVYVMIFGGRKHFYEVAGQPEGIFETVFQVHTAAELGVPNILVTNAAGGLNLDYNPGDIMVISDHNGFFMRNPLTERPLDFTRVDDSQLLWPFQNMKDAYYPVFRNMLREASEPSHVHEGVYICVPGRTYETAAEVRFLRGFADAVGMSTVPEVIAASSRGMKCAGFSCITNKTLPDGTNDTSPEEVLATANSSEVQERVRSTISGFLDLYKKM